jgi:pilus assembly protein CpaF
VLDLELSDGSRLAAAAWITERPYVAIRRHLLVDASLEDLVSRDMLDAGLATFLRASLNARLNIMFAGTTGVGKTTLMRALLHECHPDERLMIMEQEPELHLGSDRHRHNHVLQWFERPANMEGRGSVSYGDISTAIKRFRPERLVVGEVRGPEVVDMMEAMTSGQRGSSCTIHADSSWSVFPRLAIYARRDGTPWRTTDIKELASLAINLVVFIDHAPDGHRVVSEVRHVVGYDNIGENVITNELFIPNEQRAAVPNPDAPLPQHLRNTLLAHGYNPNLHYHNGVRR